MSINKYNNVAVTGGSGFIGSNFIHYIYNKYKQYTIYNIDRLTYAGNLDNFRDIIEIEKKSKSPKRYHFIKADICDDISMDNILRKIDFDIIINFAAESHVDRSIINSDEFIDTNISGVHTLIKLSKKYKVGRFIQISTDEVYGDVVSGYSTETNLLNPSNPYAASKAAADLLVQSYIRTHGLPALIVRGSNNFGSYQYPEKFIPLTITNLLEGKHIPIHGDGLQVRSWLHVGDFCNAIDLVMHKALDGSIYNVSGTHKKNIEIVKHICELLGKNYKNCFNYINDRPGGDSRYAPDSLKIQRELGWKAQYPINTTLSTVVQWYIDHQTWWTKIKEKKEFEDHYQKQCKALYY
jgi:dTDP-glucose 4,6-dehydratase|tara:strand:- start:2661 stop:3716 length:1056 start_codon:yes stop_codon:yes gene_type:complete